VNQGLLKPSPDMARLFVPFGCTHPPPSVLHFCSCRTSLFCLSAHAEPISKGHCRKWYHDAKSLVR